MFNKITLSMIFITRSNCVHSEGCCIYTAGDINVIFRNKLVPFLLRIKSKPRMSASNMFKVNFAVRARLLN